MANYNTLKSDIADNIKQNGTNAITGQILQSALMSMINSLGVGYQFVGVATPSTDPGSPDQKVFYLAVVPGVYTGFGGIIIYEPEIVVLRYSTSWEKIVIKKDYKKDNLLIGYNITNYPLLDTNVLSSSTNPNWHTYYKIPVKKGDVFSYIKNASTSLTAGYSYYIITDNSGTVLQRRDGTGADGSFGYNYTMPEDGFVSVCTYEGSEYFSVCILSEKTGAYELLSVLNQQLNNIDVLSLFSKVNNPLLKNNTLSSSTHATWHTYYKIPVKKGTVFHYQKHSIRSLTSDYSYYIITDFGGVVLQRLDATGEDPAFDYTYTMPEDGFISVCFYDALNDADISMTLTFANFVNAALYENDENTNQQISVSEFHSIAKFGVIGDSLSVGHMTNPVNDVVTTRNLYFSWGQILARRNGQKCLNFGFSGASATTWFTNTTYNCPQDVANPDNLCQAYIIGLGANPDAGGVGSMADIDWSNGNNNAATFYGQYARVVQLIRSVAPNALIFCLTLPYPRESSTYNNAIKAIATDEHVSANTFVVELTEYNNALQADIVGNYVSPGTYSKFYYNSHFTAPGYAMCAKMIEEAISRVMGDNASSDAIQSVGQIPYADN